MMATVIMVDTPQGEELLSDILEGVIKKDPNYWELRERYSWDDIGSGNLFADCYKSYARYVPERKKWFYYLCGKWGPDNGLVMELCKQLGNALKSFWMQTNNKDEEERLAEFKKYAWRWSKRSVRETILKDAASVHPIMLAEFDANPYLFNCTNGTLNLRDMTFHKHSPDDLLSKMAGVEYDPNVRCDRWIQHIREIMLDNQDKVEYLQKALGYSLTGLTKFELFFILYGPTSRNGKGVTMESYMRLMGDYGCSTRPESVTQKQSANGSAPSEDIARLAGKRFANISEPDKHMVLSAALVKTLTGNDKVTARYLNENSFEFYPQAKFFVNTNHLPKVTDATIFSSGRVKVLLFERHFEEHERDTGLKMELSKPQNLSGILNWCIEGLKLLNQYGFDEPQCVKDAVNAYREDSDKVGMFLSEMMIRDDTADTSMTDTYEAYKDWCMDNGLRPEGMTSFKKSLAAHAEVRRKRPVGSGRSGNPISCICGYRLLAPVIIPTAAPVATERTQEVEEGA